MRNIFIWYGQVNTDIKGFFITFEGPEGAGKSSQIRMLQAALTAAGRRVTVTREPGGTPLAEAIREVVKTHHSREAVHPVTELLLMEAARSQHVNEVILPALREGAIVLCDRFFDSTTAYQGGGRGLERAAVEKLNVFASLAVVPDLTVLLDLPPEKGFERASHRIETRGQFDRFEAETLTFHRRVRESFLRIAAENPARVKVVDADRDRETIHREIMELVDELVR